MLFNNCFVCYKFSMCWGQNPAPGRLMTTSSVSGPGVYCSCNTAATGENYDAQSAQYFVNNPNLMWVPTTPAQASSVTGAIKTNIHYLGRKYLPSLNGSYAQVFIFFLFH